MQVEPTPSSCRAVPSTEGASDSRSAWEDAAVPKPDPDVVSCERRARNDLPC